MSEQPPIFTPSRYANLEGKVVFDTGGASGIGRAMAEAFARHGAHLFLFDLNAAALQAARQELLAAHPGLQVEIGAGSVTDEAAVEQAVQRCIARYGRVDILLNNAGISMNKPTLELTPAEWRRTLEINLTGTFLCAQAAARPMARQRSGVILNTASMWGLRSASHRAAYCAAKAGVVSLTQTLAVEWAPLGIRVNALAPGYTRTALVSELESKGALDGKALRQRTPLGRFGEPEEMAELALFLASGSAGFITGHALVADGGWTANGF